MVVTSRPSWDEYFVSITRQVATRATCLRRKVGAIIVKEKRILTTGYNGAPKGVKNCMEIGTCLREERGVPSGERQEICRGLHAEQNAILQAALHGVPIKGSDLYSTNQPCVTCAKMIINVGIKNVFYLDEYPDPLALELLGESGIRLLRLDC